MSTNFYLVREENSDRNSGTEHIGKRSGGWVFTFQGQNFRTYLHWCARLSMLGAQERIEDEYGNPYTFQEFLMVLMVTKDPWGPDQIEPQVNTRMSCWEDAGYSFSPYDFS